jgi:hypothetical protein
MIYTQRTKMCQIYYGDYGLGVKLLTLVCGYQHFIGGDVAIIRVVTSNRFLQVVTCLLDYGGAD